MNHASGDRPVNSVKNGLDAFSETLRAYSQLLRNPLFLGKGLNPGPVGQTASREGFKAVLDAIRYGHLALAGDGVLKSRHLIEAEGSSFFSDATAVINSFRLWEDNSYPSAFPVSETMDAAVDVALGILSRVSEHLQMRLSKLPEEESSFDTEYRAHAPLRDRVFENDVESRWEPLVQEYLLQNPQVAAVWPALDHLYLFCDTLPNAREVSLLHRNARSFFNQSGAFHPMILPKHCLSPLLSSCYLNKPFKYYEYGVEGFFSGSKPVVKAPPCSLVEAMAWESMARLHFNLRSDLLLSTRGSQLYRRVLQFFQLRLFFEGKVLVLPLSACGEEYLARWKEDAVSWKSLRERCLPQSKETSKDLVSEYYPSLLKVVSKIRSFEIEE